MRDKFDKLLSAEVTSNFSFIVLTSEQMVTVGNGVVKGFSISSEDLMSTGLDCH